MKSTPSPFVTLRKGDLPQPRVPALPPARGKPGASVTLVGKWAAKLDLTRPQALVRCSSYVDPAGQQYVYEAATDARQVGEYGTEPGNLYVKVEAGPDGVGRGAAALTVSVADEDLFTAYESTGYSAVDSKVHAVFAQSRDKKSVRISAYVVMGTEFDYSRSADTGWDAVTVSIHCPR